MKKIKVSELPLGSSLQGLYTLGTDVNNNSVKVSLEFVEQKAAQAATAASNANAATTYANAAKQTALNAAQAAQTAATNANTAKSNAETATAQANTARDNANTATQNANAATQAANAAAQTATQAAQTATAAAQTATEAATEADEAAAAAIEATQLLLSQFGAAICPTELIVEPLPQITRSNVTPIIIKAHLKPVAVPNNIIFISDNRAVSVTQDGRISVIGVGRSTVQIIPTMNTSLAKVIQVEVIEPTLRLVNTRNRLRLTGSGALRLN